MSSRGISRPTRYFVMETERAKGAVSELLDVLVDRWHETCPNEERSLAQWMELSDEEYAEFVMNGPQGYIDVLATRRSE